MRRNGKLSDDLSAGRARLWLPPVNVDVAAKSKGQNGTGTDKLDASAASAAGMPKRRKEGSQRMMCLSIDDV